MLAVWNWKGKVISNTKESVRWCIALVCGHLMIFMFDIPGTLLCFLNIFSLHRGEEIRIKWIANRR